MLFNAEYWHTHYSMRTQECKPGAMLELVLHIT